MKALDAITASTMNAAVDSVRHGTLYEIPQNPPAQRWHYESMIDGISQFCEAESLEVLLQKLRVPDADIWQPMERPRSHV
jgi:hypothetical protein